MIRQAGWWTQTPSATSFQPQNWNACFWIMFKFWWSAGVIDGLEPHLPSLFSLKMKCSFLDYIQLLMISQACRWTQTPSSTLLQPKKWNAHFWMMFNFWWLAGLADGLKPHPPPLSSHKIEMLIFGLRSNSYDQLGWLMDLNPICHPSPAKKMKCSFFGLCSTSDDWLGWSMDLIPIRQLSPAKTMKCSFFNYVQLLMIGLSWSIDLNPICHPSPV